MRNGFLFLLIIGLGLQASGCLSLIPAIKERDFSHIEALIKKGVDINEKDDLDRTPLIWAVTSERSDIAKLLIDNKADINAKDKNGRTALMESGFTGHNEIAKYLIEKGADMNMKDVDGRTALMDAVLSGNPEIVDLLIEEGSDANVRDRDGRTTLMDAALNGNQEIIDSLIFKGVDINAKDRNGKTALTEAAYAGNPDVFKVLMNKVPDPKDALRALDVAMEQLKAEDSSKYAGHRAIARMLIDKNNLLDVVMSGGHPFFKYDKNKCAQGIYYKCKIIETKPGQPVQVEDCRSVRCTSRFASWGKCTVCKSVTTYGSAVTTGQPGCSKERDFFCLSE